MAKQRVTLSYTTDTAAEPIIYTASQQFNLVSNIRQADLGEDRGWVVVEFEGKEKNIEAGISWITSRGVRVDQSEET